MKKPKLKLAIVLFAACFFMIDSNVIKGQEKVAKTENNNVANSKPQVGVYYYPWYRKTNSRSLGQWRNVMRLHLTPPQEPKSGLYRSNDPEVISEHISQSVRGGIDFWAVSWWGPNQQTDLNFKNEILTHPDASKLKYAILYESTGRMKSFGNPDYSKWISDLKYIKETYFGNPNYLTANGRPVIFFYLSREYFRNKGEEPLKQMREQFPEIYLVGDDVFYGDDSEGGYKTEWAKNFDAVTAYDIYGQSVGKFGGTQKAIDFLANNYKEAKKVSNSIGTGFIPGIAPGYNDTAVRNGHPGRARYFSDKQDSKEGDIFRAMIREVALPNIDSSCNNIIMVTSFNEWFEDSQIEATTGTNAVTNTDDSDSKEYYTGGQDYYDYGYLYLDILKEEIK